MDQKLFRQAVINRAIRTFGRDFQMDRLIEEMSELTQAICKFRRVGTDLEFENVDYTLNLIEECADVFITLEQLKQMIGEEDVEKVIDHKVLLLEERLNTYSDMKRLKGKTKALKSKGVKSDEKRTGTIKSFVS